MPLSAAGTRPDPAVSVPSENGTRPAPTAVAEPELDPPGMRSGAQSVARNAVGRAHADEPGRELIEIRLADDDRPGAFEPLDDERRALGIVSERRTGGGRRQPGDVDIVLDDKRDAVERLFFRPRRLEALGDRLGFAPWAQRDEQRRIIVALNAIVSLFDRRRQRLSRGVSSEKGRRSCRSWGRAPSRDARRPPRKQEPR